LCEDRAKQEEGQLQQQDFPLQAEKLVLSLRGMNKANRYTSAFNPAARCGQGHRGSG